MEGQYKEWVVKVFDRESNSTTNLNRYGELEDIIEELKSDGLWEFVSARPYLSE